ncbi:ArcA-like protein [Colletotrichum tofieldiae]|uniref:ArcA-like protein n=1 Tax=Colletotrichum tofieldiae TaxID=708197 RepID=A0A166XQF7_9PEZI|nr:ArcA-like protein [Colletotrichum tofieldiae]
MLLRLFEEMTVRTGDDTPYGHILDTKIFKLPKSPTDSNYSLCRASILVAIRQEIFISCVAQTPPPRLAHRCGIDRTFEPASDFDWAWRIIVFTEDVLTFVYGEEAHNPAVWDGLRTYLNRWMDKRPASFNPIWNSGSDHEGFPEIMFANDFHLAGQQSAILCQILLLSHDPRVPSLGLDGAIATKAVEDEIRRLVRQICGIANSATEWPPAVINAGTAIAM